jgi:hypothetical protein
MEALNKKMGFNRFTLSFPEETEVLFREKYFNDSLIHFRIAFLLVTFLYAAFGYLDLKIVPEFVHHFQIIRFYIVVPLLLLVFLLSFASIFKKIWQTLLVISFVTGGAGISIMTMLVPDNYAYYAGLMLIFSAGYFFIKLRFFLATIGGWLTLLIFNIGAVFYANSSALILLSHNFFFISANLIGMFAAYSIEYYARRDFFLNQELDKQIAVVDDTNKNLEKTIDERTKELRVAKNNAEQADRLKSAFLANMSHEIRTPMNSILGFADLLMSPDLSGEHQQEYIGIIEKSGERMLNIINNIVDISRIESGQMELHILESNINEQVENVCTFLNLEALNKGIGLSYINPLPPEKALIKTDREKLYAILINLVKNAIKYTDEGSVKIGYSLKNDIEPAYLKFYVCDTGIGIPEDMHEAIFDRFVQADIDDRQARQGAGLGLSITKAYVEMLGGRIWVESNVGKGSTFYFTIPYDNAESKSSVVNMGIDDSIIISPVKKYKILVVEDDKWSEIFIDSIIGEFAECVFKAQNGSEAIDIIRRNPDIDLVLMDIQLPTMNGYEATSEIREFNKDVIIIAQTAYALTGDREKALEAGCNDYIAKPIKKKELLTLMQRYLKGRS